MYVSVKNEPKSLDPLITTSEPMSEHEFSQKQTQRKKQQQQQQQRYGHYAGQPVLAGTPSHKLEDFVGTKFYCLHATADSN